MTFTISVTERGVFRRCRRQWWYNSLNGMAIQRIKGPRALTLGTLVHNSLERWLLEPDNDLPTIFKEISLKELDTIKEQILVRTGKPATQEDIGTLLDCVGLGLAMVTNYQTFWKSPLPKGYHLIQPEQKVNINIDDYYTLEMKFDGLIANDDGDIYILEHKTYSQRPKIEVLNANDQFLAYIWGAKKLGLGNTQGVAYDGLWSREAPPTRPVKGTLSDLFVRLLLRRTDTELNEFEEMLWFEANEMYLLSHTLNREPNHGLAYINRRWEGCYDCQFEMLCKARSTGEDEQWLIDRFYTKREVEVEDNET